MGDPQPSFDFVRNVSRFLNRDDSHGRFDFRHVGVGEATDAAGVAVLENDYRTGVRSHQQLIKRFHIVEYDKPFGEHTKVVIRLNILNLGDESHNDRFSKALWE